MTDTLDKRNRRSSDIMEFSSPILDADTRIVIAFDGGGIRGLISAVIAHALEKASGVPLAKSADLIIGTSTGGISALLFTMPDEENPNVPKYSGLEIVRQYTGYARKVFKSSFYRKITSFWGYEKSKYSNDEIRLIFGDNFKDTLISQALTNVAVLGVEIERYTPVILRSYAAPDVFMKDAALATAAAPTLFPVARVKPFAREGEAPLNEDEAEDYYLADGAISGVNSPSLLGYCEMCKLNKDVENIKEKVIVISIGTGKTHRRIRYDEIADAGYLGWMPFLMHLIIDLPSDITETQMNVFLKDIYHKDGTVVRRFWRLQPIIPESHLVLDAITEKKLKDIKNIARNYVRERQREINYIGKILATRAEYIKEKK